MEGTALEGGIGLAAELHAACHLIAVTPEPLPFEASLGTAIHRQMLTRGVALPVQWAGAEAVQVVLSWREVLDRRATARLRREFGQALRTARFSAKTDPFGPEDTC